MIDARQETDRITPCPECGGDGGFEQAGSGKWSECTRCAGTGDVETEAASGLADLEDRCGEVLMTA